MNLLTLCTGKPLTIEVNGTNTTFLQSGTGDLACEGRLRGVLAPAGLGPGAVALGGLQGQVRLSGVRYLRFSTFLARYKSFPKDSRR